MSLVERIRRGDGPRPESASPIELFYDLVFVFAITQVSHLLLEHLSWEGAGQSLLVLLVVWSSWNYTTWVTNELEPDSPIVRALLITLMLLTLLMAIAIPEAFGDKALLFAGSYVAIQVGRHAFLTFAACGPETIERLRAGRILIWLAAAGAFWIAGALADGGARTALWLIALAIDWSGPLLSYRVPGLRALPLSIWDVGSEHFTERFQLFIIIALGETIVITGATTAGLDLDLATITAFGLAFVSTAALWWLYFNYVSVIAARRLALAADRTVLARDAYTYLHVLLVAGIVVSAVGDELVIKHPTDELPSEELIALVAGPALYLLAHVALRLRMTGTISNKRLAGALACVAVGLLGTAAPALVVAALLLAILVAVIVAEQISFARRTARGEPHPLERLEAEAGTEAGTGPG